MLYYWKIKFNFYCGHCKKSILQVKQVKFNECAFLASPKIKLEWKEALMMDIYVFIYALMCYAQVGLIQDATKQNKTYITQKIQLINLTQVMVGHSYKNQTRDTNLKRWNFINQKEWLY